MQPAGVSLIDRMSAPKAVWPIALGLACLYVPSFVDLARRVWPTDEQGHGPIVLAVSLWLAWQRRHGLRDLSLAESMSPWTIVLLAIALPLYAIGRSQALDTFEMASLPLVICAVLLATKGPAAVRLMAFPIFFTLFLVPLPAVVVGAVTAPLKAGVSWVSTSLLWSLGYPIANSGNVISVGPYQLFVADACAGLSTMFTLEALGLLYLHLMRYQSMLRNVLLGVLTVPIAFAANVVRVIVLVLVTFHLGDEAAQGFLHGFAGMLLFLVALGLILAVDGLIGRATPALWGRRA